jgi:hypothetical protein
LPSDSPLTSIVFFARGCVPGKPSTACALSLVGVRARLARSAVGIAHESRFDRLRMRDSKELPGDSPRRDARG